MKNKYFFQLAGLSAVWGASFLFTRIATPALGPSLAAALRALLGAITLGALMRWYGMRWPRGHWRELAGLGVVGVALPHFLYSWSSLYMPAGYSAVLSMTSVLFGTFASAWLKEDTLTLAKLGGCAIAMVGVALVVRLGPVTPSPGLWMGVSVMVVGAAASGIATPLLKRATQRMEPLAITAAIHAVAFVLLLPYALTTLPAAQFTLPALLAVAVMGVGTSGMAYWQYMRIVKNVSPVAALSSTFMITLFGVFWGHVFLDEVFTPASYAGAALVLLATMLVMGFNPLRRVESARG
jgi:drug/metabolite transporter (DMT)-like permease